MNRDQLLANLYDLRRHADPVISSTARQAIATLAEAKPPRVGLELAPDGRLRVRLASGRTLDIGNNEGGLAYINKMIREAEDPDMHHQRGYIREFPTQAAVDAFLRAQKIEQAAASAARAKDNAADLGVDLDALDFTL